MRLTLLFLTIFVAATHQQFIPQRVLEFPWLSPFARLSFPFQYFNQFPTYNDPINENNYPTPEQLILQDNEEFQPKLLTPVLESRSGMDENNFPDAHARIKQLNKPKKLNQENARFFFPASSTANPILKTLTLTVTSTCTQVNITSCIPPDAFAAAPGNFNPPICRRKRDLEFELIGENDQFPISPNGVQSVVPTAVAEPDYKSPQSSVKISSSIMERDIINHQLAENAMNEREKEPIRKGRFYYLWQRFTTLTTVTSWSVTSSLFTQTFSPRPINGAILFLPCLPPGYFVCPANNGK